MGGKLYIEFWSNANGMKTVLVQFYFLDLGQISHLSKYTSGSDLSVRTRFPYLQLQPSSSHCLPPPHPLGHTLHIRQINLWSLSIFVFLTSPSLSSWQINLWPLYVSKFVFLSSSSLPSWLFSPDISSTNFMLCLFFSYLPASFFFSYNLYIISYIISVICFISYRLVQRVYNIAFKVYII